MIDSGGFITLLLKLQFEYYLIENLEKFTLSILYKYFFMSASLEKELKRKNTKGKKDFLFKKKFNSTFTLNVK